MRPKSPLISIVHGLAWLLLFCLSPPTPLTAQIGGGDAFGYTWQPTSLAWRNLSGGTETGLSANTPFTGPVDIGFPFDFYENQYQQLYISRYGYLAFNPEGLEKGQASIYSTETPNNLIAPFSAYLTDVDGYVRYQTGGTAPNRWFAVEWNRVRDDHPASGHYTFEAILYENGNIDFQYDEMGGSGYFFCKWSGIENETGEQGFDVAYDCSDRPSYSALHIERPTPRPRIELSPPYQERLITGGATQTFFITVRNTGDRGPDVFDFQISPEFNDWSVTLLAGDGVTPLVDSDQDGQVDTGSLAEKASTTIIARVTGPAILQPGQEWLWTITGSSSLHTGTTAQTQLRLFTVEPVVQAIQDDTDEAIALYRRDPLHASKRTLSANDTNATHLALAETADGYVYVWNQVRYLKTVCDREGDGGRCDDDFVRDVYAAEIYYRFLNQAGEPLGPAQRLTDLSGIEITTYDYPAVAVAPNGNIGLAWYRYVWYSSPPLNGSDQFYYADQANLYYALLDPTGQTIVEPTPITNHTDWGHWINFSHSFEHLWEPQIAATGENRFVLAWKEYDHELMTGHTADLYYAIRRGDGDGGPLTAPTLLVSGLPAPGYFISQPNLGLAGLADGRALIGYVAANGQVTYTVIDGQGATVYHNSALTGTVTGWGVEVLQLADGRIMLAWVDAAPYFTILNPSTYQPLVLPTELHTVLTLDTLVHGGGSGYLSLARGLGNHAVATWTDFNSAEAYFLYYALIDSDGSFLVSPAQIRAAPGRFFDTSFVGYGSAAYDPTTTSGIDVQLSPPTPSLAIGGTAATPVSLANFGALPAAEARLTATLDAGLVYVDASPPPDTIPTTRRAAGGGTVIWNLADLPSLSSGQVILYTAPAETGSALLGHSYPITLTLTSAGDDAFPANNTVIATVVVPRPVYLPLVTK